MKLMEQSARGFVLRMTVATVMLSSGVFVAIRSANAVQGGQTRDALSFVGTLRRTGGAAVTSPTMMTFVFRQGEREMCRPVASSGPIDGATGSFNAEIPIDVCPRTLFDGSDVTVQVEIAGASGPVTERRPINPVPYARYADQVGTPDCPAGYDRDGREPNMILCRKCRGPGRFEECFDDVVRVGSGSAAFWIDRYEASVWPNRDGSGPEPYGIATDNYPLSFPDNGQWTAPVFALSKISVSPSANLTWFQANEACRNTGKRLPLGSEWLAAARGTADPTSGTAGDDGGCRTAGSTARLTGRGGFCQSAWGAQDMIGNLHEWTDEWYAGNGATAQVNVGLQSWPSSYNLDGTSNVNGTVGSTGGVATGLPSAAFRGGNYSSGPQAGAFALNLNSAPSDSGPFGGFRCAIPR